MTITKNLPAGFATLTPHLIVSGAVQAIELYQKVFGAELLQCHRLPGDGRVVHALLAIGSSCLMLRDERIREPVGCGSAEHLGGSAVMLHLYVDDVDKVFDRAVAEGFIPEMDPMDSFWGDRYGLVADPFGHLWGLACRQRELTPQEIDQAIASSQV